MECFGDLLGAKVPYKWASRQNEIQRRGPAGSSFSLYLFILPDSASQYLSLSSPLSPGCDGWWEVFG